MEGNTLAGQCQMKNSYIQKHSLYHSHLFIIRVGTKVGDPVLPTWVFSIKPT